MDHKVSKDMISSGMIPSGEKTQADLGRTQYGSAPSPSSLMDAYKSIYEHHQKDADGKVIEHGEKEELSERVRGGGVSTSLPKKKEYQKVVDKLTGYQQTQKGVGAASLIPKSAFKEERVSGGGVSSSLPKQKERQRVIDKLTGYEQTQKGVGAAGLIPDSAFSNSNPRRNTRTGRPSPSPSPSPKPDTPSKPSPDVPPVKQPKPSPKPSPKKPFRYKIDNSNMINTGLDLFDLVKGRLLDEGCDEQEAINIMVNLSEEELQQIVEIDNLGGYGAVGAVLGAGAALAKPAVDAVRGVSKFIKNQKNKKQQQIKKIEGM